MITPDVTANLLPLVMRLAKGQEAITTQNLKTQTDLIETVYQLKDLLQVYGEQNKQLKEKVSTLAIKVESHKSIQDSEIKAFKKLIKTNQEKSKKSEDLIKAQEAKIENVAKQVDHLNKEITQTAENHARHTHQYFHDKMPTIYMRSGLPTSGPNQ